MNPMTPPWSPQWLDEQYNNRARVPEAARIIERWAAASAAARGGLAGRLDLRYGPGPKETLDVFPAAAASAPVLVFIHGGYWRSLDKSDFSFIAPAFTQAGAMVVIPNYDLCPDVGVDEIALEMTRALAWTWHHAEEHGGDPRRLAIVGHSAGGHLAAMLATCDWARVDPAVPDRLAARAMSISGVHDLRIVEQVPFLRADLRLTPELAAKVSPALLPAPAATLYAVAGALESEEFLRQNALIRDAWGADVVPVCEAIPERNHFDILTDLVDPQRPLHRLALDLLALD